MKLLGLLALLALLWAAGFWAFAERVVASTPAKEPAPADGLVALTGASNIRLEAAERLLEAGKAERLLISGVYRGATRSDVKEVARGVGRAWDCCVDLGYRAEDTRGNAQEVAGWTRHHGYGSLIVVTADYHMPRAILEMHAQVPDVRLQRYPVVTDLSARRWWTRSADAKRLVMEYDKYLVILAREAILGLGRKAGMDARRTPAAAGR